MSEMPPSTNKDLFLLTDPPLLTEDPERVKVVTSQLRDGLIPIA